MALIKSLWLVLGVVSLSTIVSANSPAVKQAECEHIDPVSLIPQAEQAFRNVYKHRFAKGEVSPNTQLVFVRDEFSFNQGTWLLPFKINSSKGQETYFALVNCTNGVEFSVGDKPGSEKP